MELIQLTSDYEMKPFDYSIVRNYSGLKILILNDRRMAHPPEREAVNC